MKFIFFILAFLISQVALACDICSVYMKMSMNDRKSSVGFSYRSQYFNGTLPNSLGELRSYRHFDPYELSEYRGDFIEERYTTADFRALWWLNDRFSVFAYIPVRSVTRLVNEQEIWRWNNISDPGALLRYHLIQSKDNEKNHWLYQVITGAGVKAPLGSTQLYINENYLNPDVQSGSGSYDLLFSLEGAVSYKNTGISSNIFYRKALPNAGDYIFGDSYSSQTQFFYLWRKKELQISPSVGFYFESEATDRWHGVEQGSSDYQRQFITAGGEIAFKNVSVSGYLQKNIFNTYSGTQLDSKNRWVSEIKYYF